MRRRLNEAIADEVEAAMIGSLKPTVTSLTPGALASFSRRLQEIPAIAPIVLEDRDPSVSLLARHLHEMDAMGLHPRMVAPEIVGVEEQEYASSGLVADPCGLLVVAGLGEDEMGAAR